MIQNCEIGRIALRIKLAELLMRKRSVVSGIDIRRTSRQKNSLHPADIFANHVAISSRRNHQRQTAGPQDCIQIMPDLADIFRLLVVASRNSDPGSFHNYISGCECKPDRALPLLKVATTSSRTRLASSDNDIPAVEIGLPMTISAVPLRAWYVCGRRIARDPRIVTGTTSMFDLIAIMNPPPLNGWIAPS